MAHSYASLYCHLVWGTKMRLNLVQPSYKSDLFAYAGGIIRSLGGALVAAGGMPDHVHLLVRMARDVSISALVREIKGGTSHWVREHVADIGREFGWQGGFGAFSVGHRELSIVEAYIENQTEHHRQCSFEEEFARMMKEQGITIDPRFFSTGC